MSAEEIDQYLDGLQEPKRTTLAQLRQTILAIVPEAEQRISYGVPAFKVRGKTIAGFGAFKNHLSYLPHSGSVFTELKDQLQGYPASSGALRFSSVGTPSSSSHGEGKQVLPFGFADGACSGEPVPAAASHRSGH